MTSTMFFTMIDPGKLVKKLRCENIKVEYKSREIILITCVSGTERERVNPKTIVKISR